MWFKNQVREKLTGPCTTRGKGKTENEEGPVRRAGFRIFWPGGIGKRFVLGKK